MTKDSIDFKQIVEKANDVVIVTDNTIDNPGPRIIYVNQAFEMLTGYSSAEVVGKTPRMLQGSDTSKTTRQAIKRALQDKQSITIPVKNYTKDHEAYWAEISIIPLKDENGFTHNYAAIQREITAQKAYEEELEELSYLDPLTQAYNRRFSDSRLNDWLTEKPRAINSIMMLDIDNFKDINDKHGHHVGDKYLEELVKLIRRYLRPSDAICRTGGEEFLVLLPQTTAADAESIAIRAKEAIEKLTVINDAGDEIGTTMCIGVTALNEADSKVDDIIARADKALYAGKHSGKNKIIVG